MRNSPIRGAGTVEYFSYGMYGRGVTVSFSVVADMHHRMHAHGSSLVVFVLWVSAVSLPIV